MGSKRGADTGAEAALWRYDDGNEISLESVVILGSVLLFEGPTLCCSASYSVRHADFLLKNLMVVLTWLCSHLLLLNFFFCFYIF